MSLNRRKEPLMQATRSASRWLTLAAVAFAVFVTTLDNTVVNVALPSIQRDLHLGLSGLTWIVNGYVLSFAVLLLSGGRLADTWGRRRAFLTGLAVFTAASAFAGLAPSAGVLITARVLQGIGAALMTPATLAIVSDVFPDERERATAIGIWAAIQALAFAVGPLVGGLITEAVAWNWIFFVNVPIGIAGIALGARLIPESNDPNAGGRFDIAGVSVISGALFSLTYALIKANDYGWGSPVILALFVAAAVGIAAFVSIERRVAAPMIDLSLFRIGAFTGANVVIMIVNLATFGVLLYLSLYLQGVQHYSPLRAGATLLPWIGMVIVLAPFGARIAERVPVRWMISAGLALMGVAMLLFANLGEHSTFAATLPALLLGGTGGALTTPLSNVVIGAVPPGKAGVASGIHNTFRETGGSFGVAIIGAVFAAAQSHALGHGSTRVAAFVSGYSTGLRVAALIVLAGAAVAAFALRVDDRRRVSVVSEPMPAGA
jgi:EmrB/QacA subfamily drug resistance transporter